MGPSEPGNGSQPRLNFDVLRLVCNDLTDVPDVLSFALTCSTLRKGALQRRLGMSPVVLSHPDSVEKFHNFIFADPTARAPYLYGITLSSYSDYAPDDDPRFQNLLVEILEAAVHLEYLNFSTTIGYSVCNAVAKVTALRELLVYSDWSSHTQHQPEALNSLLITLRSPLQYLFIADCNPRRISASLLHDQMVHFAPTLESLELSDFPFNISPSAVTTPFAAMRSLHISSVHPSDFYRLDVLLRLFPNLDDTLYLKGYLPAVDEYPALREQSKEAQKDHAWPGLYHVIYSAELAFLLALRCPISCMEINSPLSHETPYLTEALRDNCPRQLFLPMTFFGHDHLKYLDGLFPPEATSRLTHLVLFMQIDVNRGRPPTGECRNFSWDQFLDTLVDSIQHLRLSHLRIVLYYHVHQPVAPVASESDSKPPSLVYPRPSTVPNSTAAGPSVDFAPNVAHDADLLAIAMRILDTMPTLEYVLPTTCGVRRFGSPWKYWHSSKAWRAVVIGGVDSSDSRPENPCLSSHRNSNTGSPDTMRLRERARGSLRSFIEMSREAAEAVIDEEELYLGNREENSVWHCIKSASE